MPPAVYRHRNQSKQNLCDGEEKPDGRAGKGAIFLSDKFRRVHVHSDVSSRHKETNQDTEYDVYFEPGQPGTDKYQAHDDSTAPKYCHPTTVPRSRETRSNNKMIVNLHQAAEWLHLRAPCKSYRTRSCVHVKKNSTFIKFCVYRHKR